MKLENLRHKYFTILLFIKLNGIYFLTLRRAYVRVESSKSLRNYMLLDEDRLWRRLKEERMEYDMSVCVCAYIYIYIYIYSEREIDVFF